MLISRSGLATVLVAALVTGCAGSPAVGTTPIATGTPIAETASPAPTIALSWAGPTDSPHPSSAGLAAFTTPVPPGAGTPWTGIDWHKVAPDDPLAQVRSVLRWGGGFVALGAPIPVGEASRTPVWVSTDGATWRPLDAAVFGPATIVRQHLDQGSPVRARWHRTERDLRDPGRIHRSRGWRRAGSHDLPISGRRSMDTNGAERPSDGVTWLHTDAYEEFYSGAMLADGRTLISIGSNNDPNPVWIGTITVIPPG